MAVTPSSSALKRPLSAFSQQSNESRKRHALETNASSLSISSEQQRRAFEADLTRLQVQLRDTQSEILDVQSQLADKDAQVSSLERERSSLLARWDEKLEEQRESDRAETDIRNHALRREVDELQLRLSETRQEAEEAKFSAREAHHQRSMALHAQEATQNTNNELSEQLESLRQELRQAQAKHQQSPAHSPSKPKPSSSHDKILGKELSSALSRLKSLEHDNQRLKREHARLLANAEHSALLRERLASAESRAKQVPALQNKLAQCDLARSILESEQRAWHVYLIDEEQDESNSHQRKRPEDIVKETARVKSQNEVLHRRLEMAKETQDGMNHLVACLEGRIDELEAQVDAEKVKHTGLKKSIKSYERSEKLLQTERNFLVAQLDNYALERKLEPEAQDAKAQETMDLMRSEMDEMKSQLQSALSSLQTKGEDSIPANEQREDTEMAREQKKRFAELYEQNSALEAELSTLHTTLTVQSKEILSLENQVDKASNLLGSGLFDSSSTRVLSLVNNPASQDLAIRKSELDLLAKENKALLARLDAMNSKHNPTDSGGVPSESLEVLKSEVEKLKQTLVQKDKAAQRIKEAFRTRATEMRAAVAGLLGFKLDMKDGGQVRLSSIYSPSSTKHLMFQPLPTSSSSSITEFKLVGDGDGLSPTEQQSFQFWVGERRCVPAWLANLFIDQYDNATMGGKMASRVYAD